MSLPGDPRLERLRADAEAGVPRAQRLLALRYLRGRGVEPDPRQALAWMERAAGAGFPLALRSLGELHEQGVGTAADALRARELYRAAAAAGDLIARRHLQRLDGHAAPGTRPGGLSS